ncbi:unnamed protein product [Rotaria sp. Silwood2]|nr:unnamed protein product [Rotaria sp. Silwood2]CAF4374178.1 unnamed protein product [Rotaria sp. Silwood2]
MGQINRAEKRDEYVRFCNMLQRLIDLDPWSESIRLLQFDDDQYRPGNESNDYASNTMGYDDVKSFWLQIKEDIDEYYEPSPTTATSIDINTKIVPNEQSKRLALFFTEKAQEDQSIRALITDLKEKLTQYGYLVYSAHNHRETEQSIFICTGRQDDEDNRQMMRIAQHNIIQHDTMRDIFILVNEAIEYFPCQFIRSIPYLTVDLRHRAPQWNENEIGEVISYINKMNILSKDYTNSSENRFEFDQELSTQCTSVGLGCAAAFYFNYAKLVTSTNELAITVGGVFQRSYSRLRIYQLTRSANSKTICFPMEVPAALNGLQNQYECILSHFNFGRFDPMEQARVFREQILDYQSRDSQAEWHKHIILIPLNEPTENRFRTAQILLRTLWTQLT